MSVGEGHKDVGQCGKGEGPHQGVSQSGPPRPRRCRRGSDQAAHAAGGDEQSENDRGEVQPLQDVELVQRGEKAAEHGGGGGQPGQGTKHGVPRDGRQSGEQRRRPFVGCHRAGRRGLVAPDGEKAHGRDEVAEAIARHGPGHAEGLDEHTHQGRPDGLAHTVRAGEKGVCLGQAIVGHQPRHVGAVRHLEQHGEGGHRRRHGGHLHEGQPSDECGDGDREQQAGTHHVCGHHQGSPTRPVGHGSRRGAKHQGREHAEHGEQPQFAGAGRRGKDGGHGQSLAGDARAHVGDEAASNEARDVRIAQEVRQDEATSPHGPDVSRMANRRQTAVRPA